MRSNYVCLIILAMALGLTLSAARGGEIEVVNANFEEPESATAGPQARTWNWNDQDGTGNDVITGWNYDYEAAGWPSAYDTATFDGTQGGGVVPVDGVRCTYVRHSANEGQDLGIWQNLYVTIEAGERYNLSIDVAPTWDATDVSLMLNYHDGDNRTLIQAEDFDISGFEMQWTTVSFSLFAAAGEPYIGKSLGVEFNNISAGDSWASFDNVRVETTVPQNRARKPQPEDGSMLEATWITLAWVPGDLSISHDVYIGDDFDAVNDSTRDSDVFRGNQEDTLYLAGFAGYAYPDGLVPGTTYYWRIDEVDDADPNSPWKGPVWSFWIPSSTAYLPTPADGINFVLPDVTLNWTAGLGASLHQVYFGDNLDEVNDATGAVLQQDTTYTPDTLELDKTYYWRVDEFDSTGATLKGDVWSFTTVPDVQITDPDLLGLWTLDEGEGTTAVDRSGHGNHGRFVGEPQWVDGYQGGGLYLADGAHVEIPPVDVNTNTVTMTAWVNRDGNQTSWAAILYSRAGSAVSGFGFGENNELRYNWNDQYWDFATGIVPSGGDWFFTALVVEPTQATLYYNGTDIFATNMATHDPDPFDGALLIGRDQGSRDLKGTVDDVRFYNKVLTTDELKQVMLGDTKLAGNPVPDSGALVDIRDISSLSFSAGDTAASHNVYLGADRDAVAAATNDSPEFKGNQAGTGLSLAGLVEFGGGDYYWRIDEVEADGTVITGTIWKFTVPDYLLVDNFEDYDAGNNEIWWSWKDGLGYPARDDIPAYAGNGTGATVGDETSPTYMEMSIVHSGGKSMPLWYDNNKQGYAKYSEAELTLPAGKRDWSAEGVGELSLWFRGESENVAEPLYVAIVNAGGTPAVIVHDNPNAVQLTRWTEWIIPLQSLADQGVSLTDVDSVTIGLGTQGNTTIPGGSGKMYIDDIRLN